MRRSEEDQKKILSKKSESRIHNSCEENIGSQEMPHMEIKGGSGSWNEKKTLKDMSNICLDDVGKSLLRYG